MKANNLFFSLVWCGLLVVCYHTATGQTNLLGLFTGQTDVGIQAKKGSAKYNPSTGQYLVTGSGTNIWGDHDAFHYVYRKMKGDFILFARVAFVGKGREPHRKTGWMIRGSLQDNAPQISVAEHGNGLTSLQFRKTKGGGTQQIQATVPHADVIELERKGDTIIMRAAQYGKPFISRQVTGIDLGNEVYVGLFACANHPDGLESVVFHNVRITVPYTGSPDQIFQMKLGSRLEILDVATGNRNIVYQVPYSIQAPNWMKDGKSLLFNDNKGLMYRFSLASRKPFLIRTGEVTHNNNDHVISFDGTMIGLSSNVRALGGSIIYTVPVAGGTPTQITQKGPSYLHGWSPDGKYLVFCGERDKEFDVYKIPSKGGKEVRLTRATGLDDGPEYSPDGKYLYFNSVRSGTMQIWRMKPDGSDQEQITHDHFNNWFAHISPDGKWMVFLSFLPEEAAPDSHPPYKHVYIRIMRINGGTPSVLAYLYGGQGSMNTPCWSPDGKKIAFISNTGRY
jgi:Tol biopolymer transport system component